MTEITEYKDDAGARRGGLLRILFGFSLLDPSRRYACAAVLRNTAPYFLLLALAPLLHEASSVAPWLLAPLMGLLIYRITIVMHDCAHGTLLATPALNRRVGKFLGAITGIELDNFAERHKAHHRAYGQAGDPQGFHYRQLSAMSRAAFLWHVFRPLAGANLAPVYRESLLHPRNLVSAVRRGEIFLVATVQLAILGVVTGGGAHGWLALLPPVSAATFGLFFSQLRGIAEHGTTTAAEPGHVRSHAPHWLDRIFLYDLNFNYHAEHHLHPQLPTRDLPGLHRSMAAEHPPLQQSMFRTIVALYASLR